MSPITKVSHLVLGRFPSPGVSPIADAIRVRRGKRGLTPLDGNLLHVPPVAEGWNSLLGAIRTKGALPGDVRELMILRVAAINSAAFEWIHHEPVGRSHGLTTAQLYIIRDTTTPLPPAKGVLNALQTSALRFADASTRTVKVPPEITSDLQRDLLDWVHTTNRQTNDTPTDGASEKDKMQDLFVEAAAVVAAYNMVSRFLISTDVAGLSDDEVPWPVERKEHFIPIPSTDTPTESSHTIHALTFTSSPTASWIVFANSLLTDLSMWGLIIPYLIPTYNILLHSQRGHGRSTVPHTEKTTIPLLAHDIAHLIHALRIPTPIHALIGVSQGGAAALAFSALSTFFPNSLPTPTPTAKSIIACDTSAVTPAGNTSAWEQRASLVFGTPISFSSPDSSISATHDDHADHGGMASLATITVPRWFPPGSPLNVASNSKSKSNTEHQPERRAFITSLIENTPPRGFLAGAKALAGYDLINAQGTPKNGSIFGAPEIRDDETQQPLKVLLLAGSLDGAGRVGDGLEALSKRWNGEEGTNKKKVEVQYARVEGAGHLPMVDRPEQWWDVVGPFLAKV